MDDARASVRRGARQQMRKNRVHPDRAQHGCGAPPVDFRLQHARAIDYILRLHPRQQLAGLRFRIGAFRLKVIRAARICPLCPDYRHARRFETPAYSLPEHAASPGYEYAAHVQV
jgi:hypothetical protein